MTYRNKEDKKKFEFIDKKIEEFNNYFFIYNDITKTIYIDEQFADSIKNNNIELYKKYLEANFKQDINLSASVKKQGIHLFDYNKEFKISFVPFDVIFSMQHIYYKGLELNLKKSVICYHFIFTDYEVVTIRHFDKKGTHHIYLD